MNKISFYFPNQHLSWCIDYKNIKKKILIKILNRSKRGKQILVVLVF